jgi:hypothetical protein
MMRDAVLEGVRRFDVDHLRQLERGGAGDASALARLQAKGWVETVGSVHLITLAGRTLLDHPPTELQ